MFKSGLRRSEDLVGGVTWPRRLHRVGPPPSIRSQGLTGPTRSVEDARFIHINYTLLALQGYIEKVIQ